MEKFIYPYPYPYLYPYENIPPVAVEKIASSNTSRGATLYGKMENRDPNIWPLEVVGGGIGIMKSTVFVSAPIPLSRQSASKIETFPKMGILWSSF